MPLIDPVRLGAHDPAQMRQLALFARGFRMRTAVDEIVTTAAGVRAEKVRRFDAQTSDTRLPPMGKDSRFPVAIAGGRLAHLAVLTTGGFAQVGHATSSRMYVSPKCSRTANSMDGHSSDHSSPVSLSKAIRLGIHTS